MWDAAYVLGSLSPAERRDFEAHMGTCKPCRQAVAEISGMPALLSHLDKHDVAAIDEQGDAGTAPDAPPELLASLLEKVTRRRRRSKMTTWAVAAAAAAVLVVGAFVAVRANPVPTQPPPQAGSSALVMTPVAPTTLSATITLRSHQWGTQIDMSCTYGPEPENSAGDHDQDDADELGMVVVGRDGSRHRLATWIALTGVTASPGGSTSMPVDQIAAVQVISVDDGNVLLQRTL
ncbi:MAG: zf-HC2 domain-containing protein [Mycobacterium sp.]